MKYLRIVELSRLLEVDYDFLQKYLKRSESIEPVFRKYEVGKFLDLHTFPQKAMNVPIRKLEVEKIEKEGVLSIPEAHSILLERGIEVHYTTVWRRIKKYEVTHIKIGSAIRIPVYIFEEEIKKGTFN